MADKYRLMCEFIFSKKLISRYTITQKFSNKTIPPDIILVLFLLWIGYQRIKSIKPAITLK